MAEFPEFQELSEANIDGRGVEGDETPLYLERADWLAGMQHWASVLPGWRTYATPNAVTNSGAYAVAAIDELDSDVSWSIAERDRRVSQLDELVAMWAAASFVYTNGPRKGRGQTIFKNVETAYEAFSRHQEPWQASHLALACLAIGAFPVILSPGNKVDCAFSLKPVADFMAVQNLDVGLDTRVAVFFWTRRYLTTAKGQDYKHFQPLVPPGQVATTFSLLPPEVMDQLRACQEASQKRRFLFSCNAAFKDRLVGPDYRGQCQSEPEAEGRVQLKAEKVGKRLMITAPADFADPLLRKSYLELINAIIWSEVQPQDREPVDEVVLNGTESFTTEDKDRLKALGFRAVLTIPARKQPVIAKSFIRSVRGVEAERVDGGVPVYPWETIAPPSLSEGASASESE
jgi:hypothetical protein